MKAGHCDVRRPARTVGPPIARGYHMFYSRLFRALGSALLFLVLTLPAAAQSFRVQCPNGTKLHPSLDGKVDSMSPGDPTRPTAENANAQIKCQHISGG